MIEQEDNSNISWKAGDKVDSVGGMFKDGEVLDVRQEGPMVVLKIKWPNGCVQERSDSIVRKVL